MCSTHPHLWRPQVSCLPQICVQRWSSSVQQSWPHLCRPQECFFWHCFSHLHQGTVKISRKKLREAMKKLKVRWISVYELHNTCEYILTGSIWYSSTGILYLSTLLPPNTMLYILTVINFDFFSVQTVNKCVHFNISNCGVWRPFTTSYML